MITVTLILESKELVMKNNPIFILMAIILAACALVACEKEAPTGALTQDCADVMTEPECKQCCLTAGASDYDFDTIDDDDGDRFCTCVKPTQ